MVIEFVHMNINQFIMSVAIQFSRVVLLLVYCQFYAVGASKKKRLHSNYGTNIKLG